jgi:hypothetical protein
MNPSRVGWRSVSPATSTGAHTLAICTKRKRIDVERDSLFSRLRLFS